MERGHRFDPDEVQPVHQQTFQCQGNTACETLGYGTGVVAKPKDELRVQ